MNLKCLKFEVPKIKVFYPYIMTALKALSLILAHFSALHILNLFDRPKPYDKKTSYVPLWFRLVRVREFNTLISRWDREMEFENNNN